MTLAQQVVLEAADPQTRIIPRNKVDGRSMTRLSRNGWAVQVVDKRRKNRVWFRWEITDTGLEAREHADIVEPAPRPYWRHWDRTRLSGNEYVVAGHTISRPAQPMLWRVFCPAGGDEPVGHRRLLAEAADLLAEHLARATHHGTPRDPAVSPGEEPAPVDLDRIDH